MKLRKTLQQLLTIAYTLEECGRSAGKSAMRFEPKDLLVAGVIGFIPMRHMFTLIVQRGQELFVKQLHMDCSAKSGDVFDIFAFGFLLSHKSIISFLKAWLAAEKMGHT